MNAGEVFLSCNNLSLEQYRTIVLSRALTGAGGCAVSIVVLVIVLLTTKRKAWENLTKRIYLATVLYTLLYSIMGIAAVNYSHPPSQESTWCEAMGFILHYSGTLVVVHYCALAITKMFQATLPVYQAARKRADSFRKANFKWVEVFLYLILLLCPLLNSWEPFLLQLPSYGNYGPLCWFRLELTKNCTCNTVDQRFLQAIPFAVACFGYFVLTFTVLLTLCGMYCKFRMTAIGGRIIRVIPTVVVLVILPIVMMVWFIRSAVHSNNFGSFSAWLRSAVVVRAASLVMLIAVGMYIHFPTHLCEQCRISPYLSKGENELQTFSQHKNSTETRFSNPHSTVTTETTPLITHALKVGQQNDHSYTSFSVAHSSITTTTTPLVSKSEPSQWSGHTIVLPCPINQSLIQTYSNTSSVFVCGFL